MKIKNHRLDEGTIDFVKSPNTSSTFQEGLPDMIILHYTAGGTAESAIKTLTDSAIKASAHLVIDFDGTVTQLVPFNTIAWHAGQSAFEDRIGINKYAIGIEIVNAGKLTQSGSNYVAWFGKSYPEGEAVEAVHRNEREPALWHRFTEEQITAVFNLCSVLIEKYNIKYILGHEEISPGRKIDPGPAFPLDKMRDKLLQSDRSDMQKHDTGAYQNPGMVTASMLNIRSGPGASNPAIANPLSKNTVVNILDEKDDWYQMELKLTGWVAKSFVKKIPGNV